MKVNTIPRCAFYTFTETEYIFRRKNRMFPEELFIVLYKLGYEIPYISLIIQKEMDKATAAYRKQLEAAIDEDNPFVAKDEIYFSSLAQAEREESILRDADTGKTLLLDNSNILEPRNSHGANV